jgi:hypothetical protein
MILIQLNTKYLKTGEASKSEIQYDEDDKEDGDEY